MSDNSHEETVSQPNPDNANSCPTGCRVVPAIYAPIEKRADAARDLAHSPGSYSARPAVTAGTAL